MSALLDFLKGLFTRHLGLKILSLVLAFLIHGVVQRDNVREADFEVPVVLAGTPKGQAFVGKLPEVVKVRVRGRWGGIRELLSNRSSKVLVDMSSLRNGENYVFERRAVEQQLSSRHVEVVGVEPALIEVRLENVEEKVVPVEVSLVGEPAPGFRVGSRSLRVVPDHVTITGPASDVLKIISLRAAPVEMNGTESDLRVNARLLAAGNHLVRRSVDEVMVEVRLEELEVTRTLAAWPIVTRGCPVDSRCILSPTEVDLRVQGLVRTVNAFVAAPPDNLVFADISPSLERDDRNIKLRVNVVKGLDITPTPATVRFSLLSEVPPAVAPGRVPAEAPKPAERGPDASKPPR
ncbi:MAG: YbbR-like domain-containing protein [Myxococcota bacterium]